MLRQVAELKGSLAFVLTISDAEENMTVAYTEQVAFYFLRQKVAQQLLALPKLMNSYARTVVWPLTQ